MPALECRDISREQGRQQDRGCRFGRALVCSNRLGKLTKSRQLSARRSWVTDFECSHVTYAYIYIYFVRRKFPPRFPPRRPTATLCLFDARSKGYISLTPFSPFLPFFPRLATVLLNPFYFTRTQPVSRFARFHFRGKQSRAYIVAWHFIPRSRPFSPSLIPPLFHKENPFKDPRMTCLSTIKRRSNRTVENVLPYMRR